MTPESIKNFQWLIGLIASSGLTFFLGRKSGKIAQKNLDLQTQNTRPVISDIVTIEQRADSAAFDIVITLGCGGVPIRDINGTVCFEPDDTRYIMSLSLRLPSLLPNAKPIEVRIPRLHGEVFNAIKLNQFPMGVRVQFTYSDAQDQLRKYENFHRYEGHSLFVSDNRSSVMNEKAIEAIRKKIK